MNKKIGFIGCGNMAKAMILSLLKNNTFDSKNIFASTKNSNLDDDLKKYKINHFKDNLSVVKNVDIIVIAVKPHLYMNVMNEIKNENIKNKIFISIAAGISIDFMEKSLGKTTKILRTMPNTPLMVNEGVLAICPNKNIDDTELKYLKDIFSNFGLIEEIDENLFDAVVAISGSSPAYMFMIIEAMADAAVLMGLNRKSAYKMAASSMLGSAKLLLETKKHPAELKDMVTSPKGTTIEALRKFEEKGLRSAIIEGMISCFEKSKKLH